MHILVVNCNTSSQVTATIHANALAAASPGTEVVTIAPDWGPESAEGYLESFITAAATLDAVSKYDGPVDAIVMAGYGEHGREGMRQLVDVPVVDVTEASAYFAALVSHRFAVVTTMQATIPGIRTSLSEAGILDRCAEIVALDLPVLDLHRDSPAVVELVAAAARPLLERGADSIVLGCAGFAGLDARLQERLGVPVLEGVGSAVLLAEALVRAGKRTSKSGPFAPANHHKVWKGWPIPDSAGSVNRRPAHISVATPVPTVVEIA